METNTTLTPDLSEKDQTTIPKQKRRKNSKFILIVGITVLLIIGLFILGTATHYRKGQQQRGEILTSSDLEKIVEVSELSTYTAFYNGVVEVLNDEEPENTDYYVSYESQVKIGIDLVDIKESVDSDKNQITIILPELKIIDVNVEFGSMDFIFVNEKAETPTVAQRAYKACIADANSECDNEMDIYLLAQKNAENIVKALINPFLKTINHPYELDIQWEG